MRQEYEMTEAELATLLDACKPVPYMVVGGVMPRTPGQNANDAWRALAAKRGFVWDTVQPVAGKGQQFFTAEPLLAPA